MPTNELTVLELACRRIENLTGSCPLDSHDEEPNPDWDCEGKCGERMDKMWMCWAAYFIRLAEEAPDVQP